MRRVSDSIRVGPPPSRAFSIARLRLAVDGEDVGAVDDDALEPVGGGAVGEMLDRVLEIGRRRVRPLVVVDHEDDRQPAHAGEVHALVRVAARRCAFAAPGDRDPLLLADPEGEPHADGDREHRRQVADHRVQPEIDVAEVHVAVAAVRSGPSARPMYCAKMRHGSTPRVM